MNTSTVLVALLVLFACASMLTPDTALADRDGGRDQDRQQQSQSEHRESQNDIERKAPQRTERENQQQAERQTPRFEKKAPQRAEQSQAPRVEKKHPQRVEQQKKQQHKPAFVQRKASDHRSKASSEHRRNVEPRRSFHIEHPRKPAYNRAYKHVPRQRYYRGILVYRNYGYLRPGFGFYYSDNDAFRWIAFTALTLAIFDHLNEEQQRMHEQAQIRATSAYPGDTIYWQDRRSSGSITVTDIWHDRRGRECRELELNVHAQGRSESTFNTVCQKRNGAWEVATLN